MTLFKQATKVEALGRAALFVLTRKDFRHLVDEIPSVERKVLRVLARRVVELSRDPTLS